ncbi:MAG: hypothetical protein KAV00_16675, partial [Phycisphaerae bacterium]|nr:hypothetical protein [Phycisphaerae bacterium]
MKIKPRILLNIAIAVVVLAGAGSAVRLMLAHRRQPDQRKRQKTILKVLAPKIKPRMNHRVKIVDYGLARAYVQPLITPQVKGVV